MVIVCMSTCAWCVGSVMSPICEQNNTHIHIHMQRFSDGDCAHPGPYLVRCVMNDSCHMCAGYTIRISICMYVYMYICIHVYMYTYICLNAYIHINVDVHVCASRPAPCALCYERVMSHVREQYNTAICICI